MDFMQESEAITVQFPLSGGVSGMLCGLVFHTCAADTFLLVDRFIINGLNERYMTFRALL